MSSCEDIKQIYLQSNYISHNNYNSALSSYQIQHNVTVIKQNSSSQPVFINEVVRKNNIIELKLLRSGVYEQESSKLIINIVDFDLKQS
jgi:hypothetical protein